MNSLEVTREESTTARPQEEEIHPHHLVIEPRSSWHNLNLRDLWSYRELFYFLTWRDIKVRYKQTVLGASWAIIQPLFNMLLFTLIFGKLAKLPSDNIPYPLFAFAGLLPWTFFSNAATSAGNSLVGNSHLITKVYFPRLIIPIAAVLAGLVDFGFALGVMAVLAAYYQVPLTPSILVFPLLVVITVALAYGLGMLFAALQVKYRDVRYLIPFLMQFWMFATPIIYPASMAPPRYRLFFELNPMTGIIEAYRVSLLGGINNASFNWSSLLLASAITLALLLYATYNFRRMEKIFADTV